MACFVTPSCKITKIFSFAPQIVDKKYKIRYTRTYINTYLFKLQSF